MVPLALCLRSTDSGLLLAWKVDPGCERKTMKTYQPQGLPPRAADLCLSRNWGRISNDYDF